MVEAGQVYLKNVPVVVDVSMTENWAEKSQDTDGNILLFISEVLIAMTKGTVIMNNLLCLSVGVLRIYNG